MAHSRNVTFLSYYIHHNRIFGCMMRALPTAVTSRHLRVYHLTPRSLLQPYTPRTALTPERVEAITRYYTHKKRVHGITCDSATTRLCHTLRANQWYHLFHRQLRDTALLVVWNALYLPQQAAVHAARDLGVTVLFAENGVLPGTMALDPCGINFENALTGKSPDFYDAIAPNPERVTTLFATPLQQRPLRAVKAGGGESDDGKPLPERYILFAMQVHDDSQILLFSPRFPDMPTAVAYVAEEVAAYNAGTGDTLQLVVKEHPSDFGRIDYTALRRSLPEVLFLRTTPISDIIGTAQAVVTVNSAVGVEGLLHLRPVITLGDAFYNVPGVVRHLGQDELAPVLADLIGQPVNRERITRFLYFLRYEYLLPISPRSADPADYQPAAQRIIDTLEGRLTWAQPDMLAGKCVASL